MAIMAARMSHGWPSSERMNSSASPEKVPVTEVGMPMSRWVAPMIETASLSEAPGARLKLTVTEGN